MSDNPDRGRPKGNQDSFTTPDDVTEQAGKNRGKIHSKEREILVKWQMAGTSDLPTTKRQLLGLLATLMMAFPNNITIIDRKQQEWTYEETEDEERFQKLCESLAIQIHPLKNKQQRVQRWVAVTKIRTSTTIQEWKNNDQFYTSATELKVYVFPHPFAYDEWDIISIGFIKDVHVIHFPREILHDQIKDLLKTQEPNPPTFQIIPQRITTSDKTASTRAYTIQCPKASAEKLTHLMTHGPFRTEPNQLFVPFRYKKGNPELFLKCIRQQNEIYYKTWIIKIEGLTYEMMNMVHSEVEHIKGVFRVVPSKRFNTIGEWKILVDQTKCSFVHRTLSKEWPSILNLIPQEIKAGAPENFPAPAISSKKVREYQESDSDADSYGSLLSVGTDVSQMTTDEASLNEMPESYKYPSYAAATMASQSSTDSVQLSSPTGSTQNEWQKEKKELEIQLKQQAAQIEKIQADLQARILRSQDLEDQLAQALDLAHSRDARHEEMLEKFEQLMERTAAQSTDRKVDHYPTTPDREPKQANSPPSKKANTNMSPHRNIYSLFRQPTGRALSSGSTSTTRSAPQRRQANHPEPALMEIDDVPPLPPPGAKSGKKIE